MKNPRTFISLPILVQLAITLISPIPNEISNVSAFSFLPTATFKVFSKTPVGLQVPRIVKHSIKNTITMAKKRQEVAEDNVMSPTDIPANLRRKVVARRPLRGNVIPRKFRRKGGGSSQPQLQSQGKKRESNRNNPSNLKILGGSVRGRRLDSPEVFLRPMMGKVREAIFSTFTSFGLYEERVHTKHLDIFSGSGSVGLESLSRGARHCTFVDLSRDCCNAAERNIVKCEFHQDESATRVVCADALQTLRDPIKAGIPEGSTYNIVTVCPPYEEVSYSDLLAAAANSKLLTEDTVIVIEYPVELGCLPHVICQENGGTLVGVRNRRYGRTVIAMYVANPTGRLDSAESRPEEFVSL